MDTFPPISPRNIRRDLPIMPQSPLTTAPGLSNDEFRRAWRLVTIAGSLGTTYFALCILGAPRTKFLTELGATATHFGWLASLGSLAILLQVLSGIIVSQIPRRKPLFLIGGILQRTIFLAVLAAPFIFMEPHWRIWWCIGVFCIGDCLGNLITPAWSSWMSDLVPQKSFNRNWASRQRWNTVSNIGASLLMALVFSFFEQRGEIILGFSLLGVIGVCAGVTDILLFLRVPEPETPLDPNPRPLKQILLEPVRSRHFRPYLIFSCYWHLAVVLAFPFFMLAMMERFGMSAGTVQLITTTGTIGVVLASGFWGMLCDSFGQKPVLQIALLGKASIPLALLAVPVASSYTIPLIALAWFVDGVAVSGVILAQQGILLRTTPRISRPMYIAFVAFAAGIVGAIAAPISGSLIDVLGREPLVLGRLSLDGFQIVFLVSAIMRLSSILLAKRIREPGSSSAMNLARELPSSRTIRASRLIYHFNRPVPLRRRLALVRLLSRSNSLLAVKELIRALDDDEPEVQRAAATALGKIGSEDASEALAMAIRSPNAHIQVPAALALGSIGGYGPLQALLSSLRQLPPHDPMLATINALDRIGDSAAILPLICLYDEVRDPRIKHRIAEVLADLGETISVDEVEETLESARPKADDAAAAKEKG